MPLTPCLDLSAAGWITSDDLPWHQLVGFGPSGFPAYARLRFLPDGPSETAQLRATLQTLTRHTRTPDDCYFCLWDGWGWTVQGGDGAWTLELEQEVDSDVPVLSSAPPAPKVVLPNRAYFLFRGAASDLRDWGTAQTGVPDLAFVWPADHAWCVAHDVDPDWAGIGADIAAIEELLADPTPRRAPSRPQQAAVTLPSDAHVHSEWSWDAAKGTGTAPPPPACSAPGSSTGCWGPALPAGRRRVLRAHSLVPAAPCGRGHSASTWPRLSVWSPTATRSPSLFISTTRSAPRRRTPDASTPRFSRRSFGSRCGPPPGPGGPGDQHGRPAALDHRAVVARGRWKAITFGSDAHEPATVARGFRDAADLARAHGFRPGRDPYDFWPR